MLTGGHLSEIPKPHKREFPGDKLRRVSISVSMYDLVGGNHYHVTVREENNPIWNRLTNAEASPSWEGIRDTKYGESVIGWQVAWDDEDAEGLVFHKTTDYIFQVKDFVEGVWKDNFSDETHYMTTSSSTKPMTVGELMSHWEEVYKPMTGRYHYKQDGG